MATVRSDGRPANRTVVFRGFLGSGPRLTFVTDARSEKIADLEHLPWSQLCWYFPVTHEQFRISGPVVLVGHHTEDDDLRIARTNAWRALAEAVRTSFTWPQPGAPRDGALRFPSVHPDPETPPPHFCLLVLDPHEVDLLQINGNPQNRWVFRRNDSGRWEGSEVNP